MLNPISKSNSNSYNSIIEFYPGLVIICNNNGKILSLNKNAVNHFKKKNKIGKKKEYYIGKSCFDLLVNKNLKIKDQIQEAIHKKKSFYWELNINRKYFLYHLFPILDSDKNISLIIIYSSDITIMRKNKIDDSDEKYKLIVENSPDVILQTTKTGKITYMSKNVEAIYGYNLDKVIGRHFRNFVPTSEMPRYLFKMREMISGKIINNFKTFVKHKDGHLIPIELSGKFVFHNNKSHFNAIMRNMSNWVETEEALKQSELQRKFILETIPDLLFIINKDGFFTSYHGNPNALYQPPEFFLNKRVESVLPDDLGKKTMINVKKALKTKKIQIFEYDLLIQNEINWFEARMIAISKDEVMIIVRDITSLKEQQNQLVKNKEYLQTIINSASEIIFTLDLKNRILIWNDAAKNLTGYSKKDIINHNIEKNKFVNNLREFKLFVQNIIKNGKIKSFEIVVNTKYKTKRIWAASPSIIYSKPNIISEILFICNDITFEKESYSKIIFGRSYIFFDKNSDKIIDIFCNILNNQYTGLIVTREITGKIKEICNKRKIDLIQMSSQDKGINAVINPDSLYKLVEKKIDENFIIFMDRLDYFINLYSYQDVITNLYKINDIVQKKNALLIIRLNPDSLSNEKMVSLKEEFFEYAAESFDEIKIDKDLYEILKFINSRNEKNIIVTYKEIGIKFSISKITVSRKIEKLNDLNLINSYKSGRTKILQLTENGKKIIQNISDET